MKFRLLQLTEENDDRFLLGEHVLGLYNKAPQFKKQFAFRYHQVLMMTCSSALRSNRIEKYQHYRSILEKETLKKRNLELVAFTVMGQEDLLYAILHEKDPIQQEKKLKKIKDRYKKLDSFLNEEARVLFPINFATIYLNQMKPEKSAKWLDIYFKNLKKQSHIRKDIQRKAQLFIPVLKYERNLLSPTISAAEACRKRLQRTGHMYICEKHLLSFLKRMQKFIYSKEDHIAALKNLAEKLKTLMETNEEERLYLEKYYNWLSWCNRKIVQIENSKVVKS